MAEVVLPIQKGFYIYLGEDPLWDIFCHIWVAQPGGPNGQLLAVRKKPFVLLHRYAVEAQPNEMVIFKDGQTWNCRPENLIKMSRSEYGKLQATERGL